MYQHPQALMLNSVHYQHEALRDADNRRLARQLHEHAESDSDRVSPSPFQRRMVALAVALVTVLGVVALI